AALWVVTGRTDERGCLGSTGGDHGNVAISIAEPCATRRSRSGGGWRHLGAIIRDRRDERPITTRQYARLVCDWIAGIRLDPSFFETHSLRRTKATPIYRRTGNLRTVQRRWDTRRLKVPCAISGLRSTRLSR